MKNDIKINKLRQLIYTVLNRYDLEVSEKADLYQDIILALLKSYNTNAYKEQGLFAAWVTTISRNVVISYLRKKMVAIRFMEQYSYFQRESRFHKLRLLQREVLDEFKEQYIKPGGDTLENKVLEYYFVQYKNKTEISRALGVSRKKVTRILLSSLNVIRKSFHLRLEEIE